MRTTVDLPDDLHRIIRSIAMNSRRSWSATAAELIRRGLGASTAASDEGRTTIALDAGTGLPVVRTARVITPEDVRAAEDDSTPA